MIPWNNFLRHGSWQNIGNMTHNHLICSIMSEAYVSPTMVMKLGFQSAPQTGGHTLCYKCANPCQLGWVSLERTLKSEAHIGAFASHGGTPIFQIIRVIRFKLYRYIRFRLSIETYWNNHGDLGIDHDFRTPPDRLTSLLDALEQLLGFIPGATDADDSAPVVTGMFQRIPIDDNNGYIYIFLYKSIVGEGLTSGINSG